MKGIITGTESYITAGALAVVIGICAVIILVYTIKAFRRNSEDRWSALITSFTLILLAMLIGLPWAGNTFIFPAPLSSYLVAWCGIIATITSTFILLRKQRAGSRSYHYDNTSLRARINNYLAAKKRIYGVELTRKVPHILSLLVLPVYFFLGYWVIRLVAEYIYPHVPATEEALGNLNAFINAPKLEMGAIMAIFTFISIFLTIFPSEIARLRNWKRYPFQSIIEPALRPSEHDLFVSHIYISVNLALGVLILTYTPLTRKLGICAAMALVAICVCGDTTAAIIGTKYGKRKIPIAGSKKSVEGAVAGFLVSLIVGSLFAGPFIGMLGASIFLAIDLVTPRPIPITDNVLNPLVISVVFWLTLPLTLPMIPYF